MQQHSPFLWVGSLRCDVDDTELWRTLGRFGEVLDVQLKAAPTGDDCWAVVQFASIDAASRAQHSLHFAALPSLSHTRLKCREWEDRSHRSALQRHHSPHQEQHAASRPIPASYKQQGYARPSQPPLDQQASRRLQGAAPQAWWRREGPPTPPPASSPRQHPDTVWADEAGDPQQARAAPVAPVRVMTRRNGRWVPEDELEDDEEGEGEEEVTAVDDDDDDEGEEDEGGPLAELWVGNLHARATRASLRRALECFGSVASIYLHPAPGGTGLQYALVRLPAAAAESALEVLHGRIIFELSGGQHGLLLRHSRRSPYQQHHSLGPHSRQQRAAEASVDEATASMAAGWFVEQEGGGTAPLQGAVKVIKKQLICDGPPSRKLWLGNVSGGATQESLRTAFGRYGSVVYVSLSKAPGHNNPYQFGFLEMGSAAEAQAAHDALQGAVHLSAACDAKPLKVRYAWSKALARRAGAEQDAAPPPGVSAQQPSDHAEAAAGMQAAADAQATAAQQAAVSSTRGKGGQDGGAAEPAEALCAACGAGSSSAALKRCSGCHTLWYCGRDCQLKHWAEQHQHDCARLAQLGRLLSSPQTDAALPPTALRLLQFALQEPAGRAGQLVLAVVQHQAGAAASLM